jgi:Flp pilus assembly protein TadD
LFNLAHTFRKLGFFTQAIEHYQQCVQLNPKNASTYSALGLAYYLNNQVHEASDSYNKALFLKSNDRFTNDLLYIALFECADNPPLI